MSAMGSQMHIRVLESPIQDLSLSSSTDYGRSKLVAESVIRVAVSTNAK